MTTVADPADVALDLDSPYPLTEEQIASFRQEGFIKLKHVLSPQVLAHYGKVITAKVRELNTMHLPMEQRQTYQKAFLQVPNIWTQSEVIKEFVFSKRLARLAAELMGVRGVRMYHDQALYKEKSGGITPWHADQFYWPLSSNHSVTAWIPLQQTPMEMGPLAFAARSQNFTFGRDLAISDESEKMISQAMEGQKFQMVDEPFDLGEVSYHLGWTFHHAGPNTTDKAREVMTVIYIDQDMKISEPKNLAEKTDLARWLPGAKPGDLADTPLNPVMWSRDAI